jgi:hypothetical protein
MINEILIDAIHDIPEQETERLANAVQQYESNQLVAAATSSKPGKSLNQQQQTQESGDDDEYSDHLEDLDDTFLEEMYQQGEIAQEAARKAAVEAHRQLMKNDHSEAAKIERS